jgi:hypothetical protein
MEWIKKTWPAALTAVALVVALPACGDEETERNVKDAVDQIEREGKKAGKDIEREGKEAGRDIEREANDATK